MRYIYADESNGVDIEFNFETSYWDVEYRPPEEAPELNIQVQGMHEQEQIISVDQADGTTVAGTIKQELYIGYEIIEDLESDNIMGMFLSLDIPSKLVPDGTVIVQSVRYRKEFAFDQDWFTASCVTIVGDSSAS